MTEAWQGVDVRTVNRVLLLGIVCFFALNFTAAEAQAQFEVDVSLQCEKSTSNPVTLEVSPGSSGSESIICQVENGAMYEKTVELTISTDDEGDSTNIGTSLSDQNLVIAAGTIEEVSLTFNADIRTPAERTGFALNATVTKMGPAPLNEQFQSTTT
ncbi:MAG: hypothetical protein NZ770_07325, partial [Candidatus Poseidoniaceae archaeon]|nr:hypothetical protein [Candidatus Poseidoniaceae archaeon]